MLTVSECTCDPVNPTEICSWCAEYLPPRRQGEATWEDFFRWREESYPAPLPCGSYEPGYW